MVMHSIIQSYLVHWYHTYLLHPGMYRTEAIISQHFYCTNIRYAVQKEVSNYDTCQRTKRSNKKYGKLPANLSEEIPQNKICVDLIGPYVIQCKAKKKLHLKAVTMIDPITGWFGVLRYDYKRAITIANLVETMWLSR